METSRIGRRPKRSDRPPRTGENRNCIRAKTLTNTPFIRPPMPWPAMSRISRGSTGAVTPMATMSIITVTKMKANAARRGLGPPSAGPDASGAKPAGGIGGSAIAD